MPLGAILVSTVLPSVIKAVIARATDKSTADHIERAIAADPVAVNELSAEKPYQSRVAIGSVVSAIGVVLPTVARFVGWDIDGNAILEFLNAAVVLWGAGYALYGRFRSGLAPLFSSGGWKG